jgi:PEP-CTERM motif
MMMKYKLTLAVMTVGLAIGAMPAALADSLNFALIQSALSAPPGNTLTFAATVSAPITNGADIYLNGDSYYLSTLVINDNDFFANAPFFLAPGHSSTFDIFTVRIPAGTPVATYPGFFEILGGASGSASNTLGNVDFSVTVTPDSVTATPEPSSFMLLGSGLAGLAGVVRRKRSR